MNNNLIFSRLFSFTAQDKGSGDEGATETSQKKGSDGGKGVINTETQETKSDESVKRTPIGLSGLGSQYFKEAIKGFSGEEILPRYATIPLSTVKSKREKTSSLQPWAQTNEPEIPEDGELPDPSVSYYAHPTDETYLANITEEPGVPERIPIGLGHRGFNKKYWRDVRAGFMRSQDDTSSLATPNPYYAHPNPQSSNASQAESGLGQGEVVADSGKGAPAKKVSVSTGDTEDSTIPGFWQNPALLRYDESDYLTKGSTIPVYGLDPAVLERYGKNQGGSGAVNPGSTKTRSTVDPQKTLSDYVDLNARIDALTKGSTIPVYGLDPAVLERYGENQGGSGASNPGSTETRSTVDPQKTLSDYLKLNTSINNLNTTIPVYGWHPALLERYGENQGGSGAGRPGPYYAHKSGETPLATEATNSQDKTPATRAKIPTRVMAGMREYNTGRLPTKPVANQTPQPQTPQGQSEKQPNDVFTNHLNELENHNKQVAIALGKISEEQRNLLVQNGIIDDKGNILKPNDKMLVETLGLNPNSAKRASEIAARLKDVEHTQGKVTINALQDILSGKKSFNSFSDGEKQSLYFAAAAIGILPLFASMIADDEDRGLYAALGILGGGAIGGYGVYNAFEDRTKQFIAKNGRYNRAAYNQAYANKVNNNNNNNKTKA